MKPIPYNIPTISTMTYNVSLVIWHGYGIDPANYREFANNIQKYGRIRDLNIEVFIPKINTIPSHVSSNNLFLFGHSSGGYDALNCNSDVVNATVVYGASHNTKKKLYGGLGKIPKDPLKKTLTMLGEKDGYFSYLNILDEFSDTSSRNHKAIVIDGTNHLCITNNQSNIFSKTLNIHDNHKSTLSIGIACNRVASVLVDYMLYNIRRDPFFLKYIQNTRDKINVINRLQMLDKIALPVMMALSLCVSATNISNRNQNMGAMDKYRNFWMFLFSKPNKKKNKVFIDDTTVWVKLFNDAEPACSNHNTDFQLSKIKHVYNNILCLHNIKVTSVNYHTHATTLGWLMSPPIVSSVKEGLVSITIERFVFRRYVYLKVPKIMTIYTM